MNKGFIAIVLSVLASAFALEAKAHVPVRSSFSEDAGKEILIAENEDSGIFDVVEQVRKALINGGRVAAVKATLIGVNGLPPIQGIRATAIRLSFALIANGAEGWSFKELDDNSKLRICGATDDWDVWVGHDKFAAVSSDARVVSGNIPFFGRKCYWRE